MYKVKDYIILTLAWISTAIMKLISTWDSYELKIHTRLWPCILCAYTRGMVRLEVICSWLSKANAHAKWANSRRWTRANDIEGKLKWWRWNANEHESAAVYSCRSIEIAVAFAWVLFGRTFFFSTSCDGWFLFLLQLVCFYFHCESCLFGAHAPNIDIKTNPE